MENSVQAEKEFKHKEAFCLMQYQCEKCNLVETLWNSRDGVTPFMISCKFCDGLMQHTNWQLDKCTPDHFPWKGQRVFIDMTPEIHNILWRANVERNWKDERGDYKMKDQFESPMEALKALTEGDTIIEGAPYVLEI